MRGSALGCHLTGHDVSIPADQGWAGLKNGELLDRAQPGFDAFITTDRNLTFQQKLTRFDIVVIVLGAPSNRIEHLEPLVPTLLAALKNAQPGRATVIQAGDR